MKKKLFLITFSIEQVTQFVFNTHFPGIKNVN